MKFSWKVWSDHGTTWLHFWSIPRNRAMTRCATGGRGLLCFSTTACYHFRPWYSDYYYDDCYYYYYIHVNWTDVRRTGFWSTNVVFTSSATGSSRSTPTRRDTALSYVGWYSAAAVVNCFRSPAQIRSTLISVHGWSQSSVARRTVKTQSISRLKDCLPFQLPQALLSISTCR